MSLYNELKRRNVLRVGAAYIVAAWLVIQVAETIFPLFGFDDTPARIVVIVLAIGFPLFLLFSWVFELTPEGLKRETEVDRTVSTSHKTGKQLDRIIIVMLALALGYFAFDKFVLDPARDADELATATQEAHQEGRTEALTESYGDKSIAVLPFINMSDDASNEYFSDGISEELLNLLTKIPELRVISRSSAFSFKGKDTEIPEIARRLNVAHILEGSVRKAGNQVRITVQLIEARSDTHLWSETYDRNLDNIFQIQDEIATAVVEALKLELLGAAPQSRKTDQETFTLVLQAKYFWNRRSPGDEERAMDLYQRALAIDPDYAPAWTGLSVAYLVQAVKGRIPREIGLAKAREAVETALLLDSELSDAHVRMGQVYEQDDDHDATREEYRQALALDPNSPLALGVVASFTWRADGQLSEAIDLFRRAADIDPLGAVWWDNTADLLIKAGRLDEAEEATRKALELRGESISSRSNLVLIMFFRGQFNEALELTHAFPDSANKTFGFTVTYHAMGRHEESDAAMLKLTESPGRHVPYLIALAHASRGEKDQAFEWLDKVLKERKLGVGVIKYEPFLRNLHDDPRWEALLDKLDGNATLARSPF